MTLVPDRLPGMIGAAYGRRGLWDLFPGEPPEERVDPDFGSTHVLWPERGVELRFDAADGEPRLTAVFLKIVPEPGSAAYGGRLPMDLRPAMSEADVRALLGPPERAGGDPAATKSHDRPWAAWGIRPGVCPHAGFADGRLALVAVDDCEGADP